MIKGPQSQRDVSAEPGGEVCKSEIAGLIEPGDEVVRVFGLRRDACAVDGKEGVGRGETRPLVTVDERMVLREAFPEGCRLLGPMLSWNAGKPQTHIAFLLACQHSNFFRDA